MTQFITVYYIIYDQSFLVYCNISNALFFNVINVFQQGLATNWLTLSEGRAILSPNGLMLGNFCNDYYYTNTDVNFTKHNKLTTQTNELPLHNKYM